MTQRSKDSIISAYLADNADYLNKESAVSIDGLADSDWPAVLAALEELNNGELPGIDCAVAHTAETLEDFDRSRREHWTDRGSRLVVDCAERPAILYLRLQIRRGEQRSDMIVVDLGERRAVLY